ncbi:hypothetical protein E6W36_09755 [Hankyongella ginsenosidimutans]|uniref:Ribbon-helix-helix domain-containing protein n=1 Tax=Hankyongella ginsenosidimutans TaxID=1763828 RepID=A0A4D7CC51_9SPHN|nr:hypothetical protein E6W36_09755 [Hankyongella ginsenosidimutans]TXG82137.1 MAG: hypothetical protein E6R12_12310 [Sphingomonadales bacterium]
MAKALIKRSVTLMGHQTSLSLEPVFWEALAQAARVEGVSINALVTRIDLTRSGNLSSALRVWLFERAQKALALAQGDDQQAGERDDGAEDGARRELLAKQDDA